MLWGCTCGTAFASFKEHSRGKIIEGYDADFTLFSSSPIDKKSFPDDISITGTVLDGEVVDRVL